MTDRPRCCDGDRGVFFPILLVLAGSVLLAEKFGMLDFHDVWRLWPLLLIAAGVHMLLNPREHRS